MQKYLYEVQRQVVVSPSSALKSDKYEIVLSGKIHGQCALLFKCCPHKYSSVECNERSACAMHNIARGIEPGPSGINSCQAWMLQPHYYFFTQLKPSQGEADVHLTLLSKVQNKSADPYDFWPYGGWQSRWRTRQKVFTLSPSEAIMLS